MIDTMQKIVDSYSDNLANNVLPVIEDPSIYVSGNDLLENYTFEDFKAFIEKIEEHLKKLNDAGASNTTWREILGTEFPSAVLPSARAEAERQNCLSVAHRKKPTWPLRRSGAVFISAKVKDWNGNTSNYESDSYEIEKHCEIIYTAKYNSCKKHKIVWQIVNTGYQAKDCLRGGFEPSNCGTDSRRESTMYTGKHYVQCFVIDSHGVCVARSKEFFINVK